MQLTLFDDPILIESPVIVSDLKTARSGTFTDNMALPIHRWFRYSAGFAAEWVDQVLDEWGIGPQHTVLDPFAGSGTVSIVCDTRGVTSIGVEAHPVVARICQAKLSWATAVDRFASFADLVLKAANCRGAAVETYPPLVQRSFDADALLMLDALKSAWSDLDDRSPESELVWLAITAILRPTSVAGTAQWQYILPNKTKKQVLSPRFAFQQQIEIMKADMRWMQSHAENSNARLLRGDARNFAGLVAQKVAAVITSPPYANNYDYADALRFEMSFWGEVQGWGDIHDKVRKHLIVSSSQHASRERLRTEDLLASEAVAPIREELAEVVEALASVREDHGGKKHYHTMIAAYCRDISLVLGQLRQACAEDAHMCWVIGDSAPYGVYCPIDRWIGELAIAAGFNSYRFQKLRDRNVKWKNRKHRVPLKEGLLWIEG